MLKMLHFFDYYGISEDIEIAKGKYELCTTWKGAWEQRKRAIEFKKNGREKNN